MMSVSDVQKVRGLAGMMEGEVLISAGFGLGLRVAGEISLGCELGMLSRWLVRQELEKRVA